MVCLNMSNKQPKNKTKERIPFKKTSETIKFFVINLAKELKILYTEKLKKKKEKTFWKTGKGQFSFQSQRKAMPMNVPTTSQLHSSHMLAK